MAFFDTNMAVVRARWPEIAQRIFASATHEPLVWRTNTPDTTLMFSGIHLTSAYDRMKEAEVQATLIPLESARATVYGMALGDLPRVLLRRGSLTRLRVAIMNPAIAASCLAAVEQTDWLGDRRVTLVSAADEADVSSPFTTAPAMLRLAADSALPLRDKVALALASPFQFHHFRQLDESLDQRLEVNRAALESDGDVAVLFGKSEVERAVVVAAGPTAGDWFDWLRSVGNTVFIIAVSTALKPLLRADVIPNAVVVIDPKAVIADHFEGLSNEPRLGSVPLVYVPTVHPDVIAGWPGPRLVTYIRRERFERLASELPRGFLHCEGTVTHAAVDLAVQMGVKEVVLVGADFSFPGHATHVVGAVHREEIEKACFGAYPEVVNGLGKRNRSRPDMVGFLRDLEQYIARHPEVAFLNTGRAGAEIRGTRWLEGDS